MPKVINSPLSDSQIINLLENDLEIHNVISLNFAGQKEIRPQQDNFEKIQTLPNDSVIAYKWLVETENQLYLLIGIPGVFFSEKKANDPFRERDEFEELSQEISQLLGGNNLTLYESGDGFYCYKLDSDSKTYTFFAYEL